MKSGQYARRAKPVEYAFKAHELSEESLFSFQEHIEYFYLHFAEVSAGRNIPPMVSWIQIQETDALSYGE